GVGADSTLDRAGVAAKVTRGLCGLAGAEHVSEAWRRFFAKGDVVGVKVNPVGHADGRPGRSSISSPAVLLEVVRGLKSAGVAARDIIVFERYASEFVAAGYDRVLAE